MFFSSKELTQLLVDAITDNRLDHDALRGLLYYLNLPSEDIPHFIAKTLCKEPELISHQDRLGKRLAFGHVNELSEFRDMELRTNRQIRISRQLNRIALYLEENKAPNNITQDFSNLCNSFITALLFFEARKQNERHAFAAEEVLLLEQLVMSILSAQELTIKFYEYLFSKLGDRRGQIVAASLLKRLEESLNTKSLDTTEQIIDPNYCPPLPKSLENTLGFENALSQLTSFLEEKIGFKCDIH